jgi:hypothetical protein
MSSPPQTTPLSQLLGREDETPMQDPSGQFGNLPGRMDTRPIVNMAPSGVGQGLSMPESTSRKEFFGLKDTDYKSFVLVFAIVLILSSGAFASIMKPYVPGAVGSDGKNTLVGSLLAAIIAVVIFAIVKLVAKI